MHERAGLPPRVARRDPRAEPVPQPDQEGQIRPTGRRRLLAVDPRLATDEFHLVQLALELALQPKPVPPDDRPDELLRVKVFRNQLPLLSPPKPDREATRAPTHGPRVRAAG